MRKSAYLQRLQSDLERWTKAGWIDAPLSEKMFADAGRRDFRTARSSPILPGLATLVIILGLLTIIAANWAEYRGIVRLMIYFALFSGAVLGAGEARARGFLLEANLTATIAAALAGGGLVVIGQLYHTSATTTAFLSLWTIFAAIVAFLLRAPLATAFAVLLAIFWTGFHFDDIGVLMSGDVSGGSFYGPYWALPIFVGAALQAAAARALGVVHLVFIGVMIWITPTLFDLVYVGEASGATTFLQMALIWLAIAAAFEITARTRRIWALRTLAGWSIWTASFYLVAAAAAERIQPVYFGVIGLSIAALAAFSGLSAYGAAPGRRWLRGAGVAGFIAVAVIFFTRADNLLAAGSAMILFGGGLIALLMITNRMLRRAALGGEEAGS